MYRARLGVGTSREVKRPPLQTYNPVVGHVKVQCCLDANTTPPVVNVDFNISNNSVPNNLVFPPISYTLPTLPARLSWNVEATVIGGGGIPAIATQKLPAGATIYIYVGTPRVTLQLPNPPYVPGAYLSGGASGVATSLFSGFPQSILVQSNGGTTDGISIVSLRLTAIPT